MIRQATTPRAKLRFYNACRGKLCLGATMPLALELLGKHLGLFDKAAGATPPDAIEAFVKATKPTQEELEALYANEE